MVIVPSLAERKHGNEKTNSGTDAFRITIERVFAICIVTVAVRDGIHEERYVLNESPAQGASDKEARETFAPGCSDYGWKDMRP